MQAKPTALTEAVFVAKVAYRELNPVANNEAQALPPIVLYNDVMKLASGAPLGHHQKKHMDDLMCEINKSLLWRKQYSDLVKRMSFATTPALAAASTAQDMPSRQTTNMLLKFKRDNFETTQIFALLNIYHPNEHHNNHGVVVNVLTKTHCERIEFPALIDGWTQCLFEQSDIKLQFLLDLDAEISIMP